MYSVVYSVDADAVLRRLRQGTMSSHAMQSSANENRDENGNENRDGDGSTEEWTE